MARPCLPIIFLAGLPLAAASASDLVVDASRSIGKLRHLNDVDNGPLCQRGIVDLSRYYGELGVRNVRLHDVAWTYDNVLDTNYIFPNWKADAARPESYDFTQTDFYLKTISALHINIIYRLGYSAEYKTAVHHYNPPDSYDKWSDISAHIVRHYNQGWANGFKLGIKYWEIWNEPDGKSLVFWKSSPESFYRLYENAARKLKALDPTSKVGAPGLASDLTFLEGMIRYCHDHQVPLDFVSWHVYTRDPYEMGNRARKIHQFLLKYGFSNAESILDEWNLAPADWSKIFVEADAGRKYFDSTQNSFGAAFDVTAMNDMQDAPVDIATFFSGTTFMWGLFTASGAPQKAYYAFLAEQRLLESPNRVAVTRPASREISAIAGISDDRGTIRVLLSNLGRNKTALNVQLENLSWKGGSRYGKQVIDTGHNLETVASGNLQGSSATLKEELEGPSVCLLTVYGRQR